MLNMLRTVPTNIEVLLFNMWFYDYVGKVYLGKGYWNPKRKLGVTMHFSEIINSISKKHQNIKQCMEYFPKLKL